MDSITPELLHEVRFQRVRSGYRPEDVDDFLVRVAAGLADLRAQLAEAEGASPENHARQLLDAARRIADDLLVETRAQAELAAYEERRRLIAATGDLVKMSDACDRALEVVETVRGELRLARDVLCDHLARLEAGNGWEPDLVGAPGGDPPGDPPGIRSASTAGRRAD